MKKIIIFMIVVISIFNVSCAEIDIPNPTSEFFVNDFANVISAEDEQHERKYYEDCLWVIYKNYLETRLKELTESYDDEIDNLKKKEIRDELISVSSKLKNKKVEEL